MDSHLAYRNNINPDHNLKNLEICTSLIDKNLQKIGEGMAGQVYKIESSKCGAIVLKKYVNIKSSEQIHIQNEIYLMKEIKKLIDNNICPNYIYYYDSYIDKNINKINNSYILMEYADTHMLNFFDNIRDDIICDSFYFQLLVAIMCYQKYLKAVHTDIRLKNIVYKKINPDTVFNYNINNINYYIPTNGYLFMLIDYEQSQIYSDLNNNPKLLNKINSNYDFKHIQNIYRRPIKKYMRDNNMYSRSNMINLIKNKSEKKKLLEYIKTLNNNNKNDDFIDTFIFHYILDNNFFDYSRLSNNLLDYIKYMENLNKILFQNKSEKSIETILKENFSKYLEPIENPIKIETFIIKF